MCSWTRDALQIMTNSVFVNFATLVVALCALYVSSQSRKFAQKAFSFSLFNNRYEFYCAFKRVSTEAEGTNYPLSGDLPDRIDNLRLESKYIFGKDIEDLLTNIHTQRLAIQAEYQPNDNSEKGMKCKKAIIDMRNLFHALNSDSTSNIDSYFTKYLADPDFRKPIIR
jgi:hypothetical protein